MNCCSSVFQILRKWHQKPQKCVLVVDDPIGHEKSRLTPHLEPYPQTWIQPDPTVLVQVIPGQIVKGQSGHHLPPPHHQFVFWQEQGDRFYMIVSGTADDIWGSEYPAKPTEMFSFLFNMFDLWSYISLFGDLW